MLVMFAYLAETATGTTVEPELLPNPAEELEASFALVNEEFPVFQRAPRIIQRSLLFPYVGGAGFVHQLWRHRSPEQPRRAPLGELLPQSTSQVLHPLERFIRARDEPLELRFHDEPGWTIRLENNFGEFEMRVFLEEHLGAGAANDARGWAGDRFRLIDDEAGRSVLVWYSAWADDVAADRFGTAVERVARLGVEPARWAVERTEIGEMPAVRVVVSNDAALTATAPRGTVFVSDELP
jgi:hypothetical protein